MINAAQRDLLKSMYGYDDEAEEGEREGSEIATIIESTVISPAQIILYLNKAVTEGRDDFLVSLDQLCAYCQGHSQPAVMELIRALKRLNDICCNSDIRLERQGFVDGQSTTIGYYNEPILPHMLGRLGSADSIDAGEVKKIIQEHVQAAIARQNTAHPTLEVLPRDTRLSTDSNVAWRAVVGLPNAPVHAQPQPQPQAAPVITPYQQRLNEIPVVQLLEEPIPASTHYTASISGVSAFTDIYRDATGNLRYDCRNEHVPNTRSAQDSAPNSLGFQLVQQRIHGSREKTVLIVSPNAPGSRLTLLGDYCQHAEYEQQEQLANAAIGFVRNLIAWETPARERAYLPIAPNLLLVERNADGQITLNRVVFKQSDNFRSKEAGLTMMGDRFSALCCSPESLMMQHHGSANVFELGASLFLACFSEAEFLAGLTQHLGYDASQVGIFDLLRDPFLPTHVPNGRGIVEHMIQNKREIGALHPMLANLMLAALTADPIQRAENVRAFLDAPAPQQRPGLHM